MNKKWIDELPDKSSGLSSPAEKLSWRQHELAGVPVLKSISVIKRSDSEALIREINERCKGDPAAVPSIVATVDATAPTLCSLVIAGEDNIATFRGAFPKAVIVGQQGPIAGGL